MFYSKIYYSKTEKIHHKTLEVIYYDKESYNSLSLQSNSASLN